MISDGLFVMSRAELNNTRDHAEETVGDGKWMSLAWAVREGYGYS